MVRIVTTLRQGVVTDWVQHPDPADSQIVPRLVRIVTTLRQGVVTDWVQHPDPADSRIVQRVVRAPYLPDRSDIAREKIERVLA